MTERPSPTRARRLWLEGRLRRARSAIDVLDRKRQVLLAEDRRLTERRDQAEADWLTAAMEARRWGGRARAITGTWTTTLVSRELGGSAGVSVSRVRTVGVEHPELARVDLPAVTPEVLVAGGNVIQGAVGAHRRALEAAAACAVADSSCRAVHAELKATERRQRAIEHIRIPALESELRAVLLRLDELERQERLLSRWAAAGRERP